jgi:hypothetical protein
MGFSTRAILIRTAPETSARSTSRRSGRLKSGFLSVITLSVALGAPDFGLAQTGPPRQPVGIYARPDIDGCVNNPGNDTSTDGCISNQVAALLSNPAISGISAFVNWSDISMTSSTNALVGTNDWSILDDIFAAVAQWNALNPTNTRKTIQLGLQPGFHTPQWVFNNLTNCDPMFLTDSQGSIVTNSQGRLVLVGVDPSKVTNTCGCASFLESEDKANPTVLPLPLPWNSFYTNAWVTFIHAVAGRYGTNPLLVSMAVAGPTASSCEIILPNENNDTTNYLKWNPIIALEFPDNPEYTNSDILFIKAWEDAIDLYGEVFSNLTLVVTTGTGLPNFLDTNGVPYPTYSVPPGFAPDCADTNLARIMDCAAETTILAYFANPQHGGNNAKATQESGLGAVAIHIHPLGGGDLDAHGIKWLAQNTTSGSAPLPGTSNVVSRVLGGLQFDTSFSMSPQTEGCPQLDGCSTNNPISPEQAFYNVLQVYFDGTRVGGAYGVIASNLPLNYVQIYAADILYANTNTSGSTVTNGLGSTNNMTASMLFTNASFQISEIAEFDVGLSVQAVGQTVQLTWLATTPASYQLQVNQKLSDPNGWKLASQTPTTNGDYCQVSITPTAAASFFRLAPP